MPKQSARTSRERHAPTLAEVRKWPATVSVTQAATALGISKSHLYDLLAEGQSPVDTIPLGGRYRVITASLVRVLDPRPEVVAA